MVPEDNQATEAESQPALNPPVIVVGLDGSESSSQALLWAYQEAKLRGAVIRAVKAWELPIPTYAAYIPEQIYVDAAKDASTSVDDQIERVLGPHPDVTVTTEVHEGDASQVILDHSEDADMIVVGSRGLGGFSGVLLGSVSSRVVHHAKCPVVVIRS